MKTILEYDREARPCEFDMCRIMRDESGALFMEFDSGCSCPKPFEDGRSRPEPFNKAAVLAWAEWGYADTSTQVVEPAGLIAFRAAVLAL